MATIDDLSKARWFALRTEKQIGKYNPDNGIPQFWREHRELGSPLTPEVPTEDGTGVYQAFVGGVVKWTQQTGAEVVSG